jgi:hypothetical protein
LHVPNADRTFELGSAKSKGNHDEGFPVLTFSLPCPREFLRGIFLLLGCETSFVLRRLAVEEDGPSNHSVRHHEIGSSKHVVQDDAILALR